MIKKKFINIARSVISLEIKALQNLKKNINNSFSDAVVEISKCQSKVILCGVGKSGLIASKIAATLASVGTPSFNLAASEASHGDLGMISKDDILILISNSGQTSELKNIIQYANRNKILLIGIVSKKDSILYKASDIKLLLPKVTEAEGIIPTSSTTAQLALGDALAICSMKYKKFGKLDFKKLHPAGSLGSQLKTVEDIILFFSIIFPDRTLSSPAIVRSMVVLPIPDGPKRQIISPSFSIFRETLLTLFLSLAANVTFSISKKLLDIYLILKNILRCS